MRRSRTTLTNTTKRCETKVNLEDVALLGESAEDVSRSLAKKTATTTGTITRTKTTTMSTATTWRSCRS